MLVVGETGFGAALTRIGSETRYQPMPMAHCWKRYGSFEKPGLAVEPQIFKPCATRGLVESPRSNVEGHLL
jgi:hypothetical protein